MSKLKPNKGLKKRVRLTAKGKVKVSRAFAGHLRSHKDGKLIRSYRKRKLVGSADLKKISAMLCTRLTRGDKKAATAD
ncbi:MAG: 50S ribosomal protein L35 [Phycisphaerales bacterium]|jgi:large subunit ribosomal protein L35|nr:50S ribosomal protein L35 [Phycisphaerales bacterium]